MIEPRVNFDELINAEDGRLHFQGQPFTGVAFSSENTPDGGLFEEEYFHGYPHGVSRDYFPSGQLRTHGNHYMGVPHGQWKFYASDGSLREEVEQLFGTVLRRLVRSEDGVIVHIESPATTEVLETAIARGRMLQELFASL